MKKTEKQSGGDALLEDYYPIIEGRVYRYRYESAEWPQKSTATMRVKNVSSAGGKTTAVWEETNPDPPDPKEPWVRKWNAERSAEGVMEGDKDWSQWVIRTPLRVDTTWESGASKFTIRSLKKTVKVPAGVFKDCLAIGYEAEGIGGGTLYYAKGVGLVRSSQWGEWVPYDYWLKSVTDGQAAPVAHAETAAVVVRPRLMMVLKGQRETA